jgi:CubicO group peptidase (beta-lactamase class C family)
MSTRIENESAPRLKREMPRPSPGRKIAGQREIFAMKSPIDRFTSALFKITAWSLLVLGAGAAQAGTNLGLPEKSPAAVGFSAARLERVPAMLHREIDAQHYAGAVWLVARDGAVAAHGAVGWSDVATHTAISEDTVFRIFSMTKIVTTVTVLTLVEEGRINLDDPVELYLPELAKRQVLVGGTAEAPQLEPAAGPITIRQLLTHTSGLTYDIFAAEPLRTIWLKSEMWRSRSLQEFVGKVAALPLAHQPGARWTYGVNMDILGAVIEKVTGQDLETAMRERIFQPLGMTSTTFRPGPDMLSRLATIHHRTAAGGLEKDDGLTGLGTLGFLSGGGGLFSTLHDYARFGQMLLNGGELDGVRVLGRLTVQLMATNQIAYLPAGDIWTPPAFGFGVRVRPEDPHRAKAIGSPGEFGWDGLATTYVSMNPKERMLIIVLLQHAPWDEGGIFEKFENTVYQAVER